MQHAVRFNVEVGEDRIVRLPGEVPPGRAEIIVLVSAPQPQRTAPGLAPLVGILRTEDAAPTDDEVKRILDDARTERAGR